VLVEAGKCISALRSQQTTAIAESRLLPAFRTHPDAIYLADGMSCRVQLDDLAHAPAMHLAELFAARLEPGDSTGPGD
jgi:hypothetical protein